MAFDFEPKLRVQTRNLMNSHIGKLAGDLDSSVDSPSILDSKPIFTGASMSSTIKQEDSNYFISTDDVIFEPTPEKENEMHGQMNFMMRNRNLNCYQPNERLQLCQSANYEKISLLNILELADFRLKQQTPVSVSSPIIISSPSQRSIDVKRPIDVKRNVNIRKNARQRVRRSYRPPFKI